MAKLYEPMAEQPSQFYDIGPDRSAATLGEGMVRAGATAAQAIDQLLQTGAEWSAQRAVDKVSNEYLSRAGVELPGPVKGFAVNAEKRTNAYNQGQMSETEYLIKMQAEAKRVSSMFPSYRKHVDATFKSAGFNPANSLMNHLEAEAERSRTDAQRARDKRISQLQSVRDYVPPELYSKVMSDPNGASDEDIGRAILLGQRSEFTDRQITSLKSKLELNGELEGVEKEELRENLQKKHFDSVKGNITTIYQTLGVSSDRDWRDKVLQNPEGALELAGTMTQIREREYNKFYSEALDLGYTPEDADKHAEGMVKPYDVQIRALYNKDPDEMTIASKDFIIEKRKEQTISQKISTRMAPLSALTDVFGKDFLGDLVLNALDDETAEGLRIGLIKDVIDGVKLSYTDIRKLYPDDPNLLEGVHSSLMTIAGNSNIASQRPDEWKQVVKNYTGDFNAILDQFDNQTASQVYTDLFAPNVQEAVITSGDQEMIQNYYKASNDAFSKAGDITALSKQVGSLVNELDEAGVIAISVTDRGISYQVDQGAMRQFQQERSWLSDRRLTSAMGQLDEALGRINPMFVAHGELAKRAGEDPVEAIISATEQSGMMRGTESGWSIALRGIDNFLFGGVEEGSSSSNAPLGNAVDTTTTQSVPSSVNQNAPESPQRGSTEPLENRGATPLQSAALRAEQRMRTMTEEEKRAGVMVAAQEMTTEVPDPSVLTEKDLPKAEAAAVIESVAPPQADVPKLVNATTPEEVAEGLLGYSEKNPEQNAVLASFIKKNAGININPANTAWCAAWANAVLGANNVEGTGKLNARSFLDWGTPVDKPEKGDIVVFSRGDPNGWQGHVGFFQGFDDQGNILVLGGNQGNAVNIKPYKASRLLGYRRAKATA